MVIEVVTMLSEKNQKMKRPHFSRLDFIGSAYWLGWLTLKTHPLSPPPWRGLKR